MKEHVFVYGTLKSQYHNHYLLEGRATYIGDAVVPGKLYGFGLPGYVMGDEGEVCGEVYSLNVPQVLNDLDRLEGYNVEHPEKSFYIRSRVTATLEKGATMDTWVYEINRGMNEKDLIKEGKW